MLFSHERDAACLLCPPHKPCSAALSPVWFLILIARFVTIVLWLSVRVTPMHHLMIMVSSAASGPRRQRSAWQ